MNHTDIAIIGAGPYGLSLAAHLHDAGADYRIIGRPMEIWRHRMPAGMMLKSDGFASDLSDPRGAFRLKQYCAEQKLPYHDTLQPVKLSVFTAYGVAFQQRMVPKLENALVVSVTKTAQGFQLTLDTGEIFTARQVVVAVGISYYDWLPECLGGLPSPSVLHASQVPDPAAFAGKEVAVIGSGASAIDVSGLLHEAGAKVTIVSRRSALHFHTKPTREKRSFYERLRAPGSGLGPGWKSRLATEFPHLFRLFPVSMRLDALRRMLGPSAGWPMRERVDGKVPVVANATPERAQMENGRVRLTLRTTAGESQQLEADHVIAGTGYRVDLRRLPFLDQDLQGSIRAVNHMPLLSSQFESSVPGLYFIGVSSALSFGPMMRFAYGSAYTARRLKRHLVKRARRRVPVAAQAPAAI